MCQDPVAQGMESDSAGVWSRQGKPLKIVVDISDIFQDLAPVLVAQLQRAGFDASFRMTSDSYSRMTQGQARTFMMGQSGSVREPHFTLSYYHSLVTSGLRAPPPNTSGAGTTTSSTLWWTVWDSRRRGHRRCRPCSARRWISGSASCRRSPSSSGTTACPTTRRTGQAGRLRPIPNAERLLAANVAAGPAEPATGPLNSLEETRMIVDIHTHPLHIASCRQASNPSTTTCGDPTGP